MYQLHFLYKLSSYVLDMGLSALRIDKSDAKGNFKNASESLECKNKEYAITAILWED